MGRHTGVFQRPHDGIRQCPASQLDDRGVKLDVVHVLDARVLQDLVEEAAHSATDQQDLTGRRVFEQGNVGHLLRRQVVRPGEHQQAVDVEAARWAQAGHNRLAVHRGADCCHIHSQPHPLERGTIQAREEKGSDDGGEAETRREPSPALQPKVCRGREIQDRGQCDDLKAAQPAQKQKTDGQPAHARPNGFREVDPADLRGRRSLRAMAFEGPYRSREQETQHGAERENPEERCEEHRHEVADLTGCSAENRWTQPDEGQARQHENGGDELRPRERSKWFAPRNQPTAEQAAAEGGAQQPNAEEEAGGQLIAVEGDHQLSHEHGLGENARRAGNAHRVG